MTEIKALFGLYYLCGVLNMNHVTTKELFDKNSGIGYFRAKISEARFEFLTNCLRFDNRATREERRENDRLAPIRQVFDDIVKVSSELYSPSEYCTLDEMLLGFRGRCVFKMYIPSKPDKYGIKIVMLCDSKTAYMINAFVYLGKDSTPRNVPCAEFFTMKLTEPIHGSNRNLACDNLFTSLLVANQLFQKQVTIVGTLRKNKREIPPLFLELRNRDKNTAQFAFSKELTLLSYCQ
ncbi:piggyBac transposable element-derived protein 4-like [Colias croceus]|uniref:piggyBac transposable element-derived protein 4-like n=1 Tax=Colias crocea TaxID=72248 RepID=UPI001E27AB6B|nr:piggyBac transposable element-derived protein 4-like [Colias croceus]